MSNDLISREDVIELLTRIQLNDGSLHDAKMSVGALPEAYDIDKVVEQLEELKNDALMFTGNYEDYNDYYAGETSAFETSIEVVKGQYK